MSRFYNYEKQEIDDYEVVSCLKQLPSMYENGELSEVQDICYEIYMAIQEYEADG